MKCDQGFQLTSTDTAWIIKCGNLELTLDKANGCYRKIDICRETQKTWSEYAGDVTVRDDLLRKTFTRDDLESVKFEAEETSLISVYCFGRSLSLRFG